MAYNLKHRSFLKLLDFTQRDIEYLLDLARDLKRARYGGYEEQKLRGRNIALIFEKASTRTRCAFEVAAYDQGANVTFLDPASSHIGRKESIRDTARVLGRKVLALEGLLNVLVGLTVAVGTMILALGLYDRFIAALAGATRLALGGTIGTYSSPGFSSR